MSAAPEAVESAVSLSASALKTMGFGESLSLSVVGFLIVFFVLVVLMAVIKILRGVLESMSAGPVEQPVMPAAAAPAADPNAGKVPAKGSLGEVMLHGVDDKTAAMVMAIVADELKAPLNELRFISIREKK